MRMNIVWSVCVIVSIVCLVFTSPDKVLSLFVDGASSALKYALELVAVYAVWTGVFEIAERAKAVEALAKLMQPLNKWLYGNVSQAAAEYISLNTASNLLGVGNASTPSAIAAIKETEHGETLSRAGAMLFVVNASGVQLVPTTVIGLRASLGSANAADILLPTLISTVFTAVVGVALVCVAYPKRKPAVQSKQTVNVGKKEIRVAK